MKTKTLLILTLAAVGCICLFGASGIRVRWTDDESRAWQSNKWIEHCKLYGAWSNNVIFAYDINTNWTVAAFADGTKVELGFREDGVVVWRRK
jgi:hypothetical protein